MALFSKIKNSIMNKSRSAKLDHFYSLCQNNSTVLDVGVSNNEHDESINLFLNKFRFSDSQYTGLAIQPMDALRLKHPDKKFVEYDGRIFPFQDQSFDWVFSNAVIEHVGSKKDQLLFVNEMLRVSKNVFFTTPNKWFPVESHTDVIFRHWNNKYFYNWCKKNNPFWNIDNLYLFSKSELKSLLKSSNAKKFTIKCNRTLGWTMTFSVICSAEAD